MATQANNPPAPVEQKPVSPSPAQMDSARSRTPFNQREDMFVKEGLAPAPEQTKAQDSPPLGTQATPPSAATPEPQKEAVAKPPEAQPSTPPSQPASQEPPKLYAGKYKTVEELEKAYKEAQTVIVKQGTKVNQTLEEMTKDLNKAKEVSPIAAVPDEMPDPVLDPEGFKGWQRAQIQAVRNEGIATDRFKKAADQFSARNRDLEEAKAMEWVNARLLVDPRFVQGYQQFLRDPINTDLAALDQIAQEHADYVRGLIGELRVAGRQEERQKQAEIMPQITPQSPERPPETGTPSTPEDSVDETVRLRREFLQKRGVSMANR